MLNRRERGTVLSARILAEIGDDRTRFATARGLKAFAGTAPITRASAMKQAPRPDRLLVGPADDRSVTPREGPLHCPARTRGQLQRRRPQPRQPRHRDAAPLLADSSALRREQGSILSCQPATPGKPPASQACQRGRGHADAAPAHHDEWPVTSFVPPASQACRKTEAHPLDY